MLKDFLKRIVKEAIKELIAPEFIALRKEIGDGVSSLRKDMDERFTILRKDMDEKVALFHKDIDEKVALLRKDIDERFTVFRKDMDERFILMHQEIKAIKEELRHLDRRLDDLYKTMVRKEEHYLVVEDVKRLKENVDVIMKRVGI